jgi:hypothetical protein
MISNTKEKSNSTLSVLELVFDSKLSWTPQVQHALMMANKALNAIKIIR